MSNIISNDLIQKYLHINADKIFKQIVEDAAKQPIIDTKTKLLNKEALKKSLSKEESSKIITRQHELISANMAPSPESAYELFADPKSQNFFINSGYIISHNLIYSKNNSKYTFNLDEINKNVNLDKDAYGGRFIFYKINIVNKSTNAFTAKSNYLITVHILFNFFDDLKENLISARNIFNPEETREFSVINLLYPEYDKRNTSNTNTVNEQRNGNGLILNQVLNISPGTDYFKETKKAIGSTEIHKNYHLTFRKHSINIFKSQEPAFKVFDSELVLEYASYEVDESVNQSRDLNTPSLNNNMYTLLTREDASNNIFSGVPKLGAQLSKEVQKAQQAGDYSIAKKSAFQAFYDFIKNYNKELENIQRSVKCKEAGVTFTGDQIINPGLSLEDFKKQAADKIKLINENIEKLKEELSVYLFRYIINNLDIYEFEINSSELVKFSNADWLDAAIKSFSGNFGTATTAGMIGGAIVGPAAAIGIAQGVNAVNAAIQGAMADGEVLERGSTVLRDSFRGIKINKIFNKGYDNYSDFILGRVKTARPTVGNTSTLAGRDSIYDREEQKRAAQQNEQLKGDAKTLDETIKSETEKARTIEDENEIIKVRFTLFGELIDIMPKDDNVSVVIGGKTVPTDRSLNSVFLNYYYLPIDYYKLLNFLNEKIVKSYKLTYSSEVFLREIVDAFLKDPVISEGATTSAIKEIIPTHVTTNVHLVDGASQAYKDFLNNSETNILADDAYKKLKTNFILSKNLNPRKGKKNLKKIYTITGNEEINYYNFYEGYKSWKKKTYPTEVDTTVLFQEYMIKNYSMPCIRTKPTDIYGSILINKNLTFSRKDNPNLVTGQTLDNGGLLRLPYNVAGAFKPYIFFFLDVASFMFVAPPDKRNGKLELSDTFGFNGLYLIKNSSFEYMFQLMDSNNAPTFPNEKSKCELEGILITYGDGRLPTTNELPSTVEKDLICKVESSP
jgi:hypothetical protein